MNLTSFFIYCVIVTATPGPTNIMILSTVHNYSPKKAMEFAYGAATALCLLLSASALLNSILLTVIPKILPVMQVIGSVYMVYLAYQIYKMDTAKSAADQTAASTFLKGFLMQFVNPKVILFTMTVFPSFILPYYTEPVILALFVLCITCIGFLAFVTWVLFGTIFKEFLQKHQKFANIILAAFLVYSAVMVSGVIELIKSS